MNSPLTKHQWIGLLMMTLIISVFIGSFYLIDYIQESPIDSPEKDTLLLDQIRVLTEKQEQPHYLTFKQDTIALFLHPFDPNTADSIELLQLGFRPWMAKNMLRYRSKGGIWRTKQSLRKVYGMTDELYSQIEPYIVITLPEDTLRDLPSQVQYSLKKDTILELNSCDTAELKFLRGIGSYYARQIVHYRNQLGGYISANQLYEIKEIPPATVDSILQHFTVDNSLVTPIPLNHASVQRLSHHPYLSFTQAKAIYELRRTRFRLHSLDELSDIDCLTETEIQQLAPYLSFEE